MRKTCQGWPGRGGELNQVWTNLIDNAIDAVDGRGSITIRAYVEGDRVVVEVADDGRGIPREAQVHVFEPFYTTKDIGAGTGLGLFYRKAHRHRSWRRGLCPVRAQRHVSR